MASKLKLDIVTVERRVFSEEVDAVIAPGIEGELGILPRHTPLMTALKIGELRIRRGDEVEHFAIGGGFMEVRPDRVIVLADTAERAEEIDIARAEEARRRAEKMLEEGPPPEELSRLEGALRRSKVRLQVARRRRRRRRRRPPGMREAQDEESE